MKGLKNTNQHALRILVDRFEPGTEAFRKFLNLLGEWYTETDGGRRPEQTLKVESNGNNARMKDDLKRWGFPVHLLPAVRRFQIKLGEVDKLAASFGLKRKAPGALLFDAYPPNLAINRYIWYMGMQMGRNRNDPNRYWTIAKLLLRSTAYQVACINHVLHNWHRDIPYHRVLKIAREVRELVDNPKAQAEIKRKYIPKTGNKWRPLGVPSPAWRVYSHMWQNILTMYLFPGISPRQHGFLPGKGVLTAWKDVMKYIVDQPWIKEYDLKNFFGELSIDYVYNWMTNEGIPEWACKTIKRINRSLTVLGDDPAEDLTPEPERSIEPTPLAREPVLENAIGEAEFGEDWRGMSDETYLRDMIEQIKKEILPFRYFTPMVEEMFRKLEPWEDPTKFETGVVQQKVLAHLNALQSLLKFRSGTLLEEVISVVTRKQLPTVRKAQAVSIGTQQPVPMEGKPIQDKWQVDPLKFHGLPQGLATSPILSIGALSAAFTERAPNQVAYADDFVMAGPTADSCSIPRLDPEAVIRWTLSPTQGWGYRIVSTYTTISMDYANIKINDEKSSWVKVDGAWIKPLKFLGAEFDGKTFRAATKKGATLEFSSYEGLLAYLHTIDRETAKPSSEDMWNLRPKMEGYFADLTQKGWMEALRVAAGNREFSEDLLTLPAGLRRELSQIKLVKPWEQLFKSKLYGFFLARMQSDTWNIGIDQDFSYTFIESSWGGLKRERWAERNCWGVPITIFNASSAAAHCLAQDILAQVAKPIKGFRIRRIFTKETRTQAK